jgi:hypothetical protein
VLLDDQTPPIVEELNVDVDDAHIIVFPVITATVGNVFMVMLALAELFPQLFVAK